MLQKVKGERVKGKGLRNSFFLYPLPFALFPTKLYTVAFNYTDLLIWLKIPRLEVVGLRLHGESTVFI